MRCPTCDRPLATQADYDACPDGCTCARCLSLCWVEWGERQACRAAAEAQR